MRLYEGYDTSSFLNLRKKNVCMDKDSLYCKEQTFNNILQGVIMGLWR